MDIIWSRLFGYQRCLFGENSMVEHDAVYRNKQGEEIRHYKRLKWANQIWEDIWVTRGGRTVGKVGNHYICDDIEVAVRTLLSDDDDCYIPWNGGARDGIPSWEDRREGQEGHFIW